MKYEDWKKEAVTGTPKVGQRIEVWITSGRGLTPKMQHAVYAGVRKETREGYNHMHMLQVEGWKRPTHSWRGVGVVLEYKELV